MGKLTFTPLSLIIIIVSLTALTLFHSSEGLECYSCWSEHNMTRDNYTSIPFVGIPGHSSCERGRTPDVSLKSPCPTTKNLEGEELQPVCVKIFMNLSYEKPSPLDYKIAYRGCFYSNPLVEDLTKRESCSQRSREELERLAGGPMGAMLASFNVKFPTNMTTQFCHCSEDNCNAHFLADEKRFLNSGINVELGNDSDWVRVAVRGEGMLLSPSVLVTMMMTLIVLPFLFY